MYDTEFLLHRTTLGRRVYDMNFNSLLTGKKHSAIGYNATKNDFLLYETDNNR